MITLSAFEAIQTETGVHLSCKVDGLGIPDQLYFDIDTKADCRDRISANPAPFAVAILHPAMERGEDIYIDGTLDATLLHKLRDYAVSFLGQFNRSLTPIEISCASVTDEPVTVGNLGALIGLSCGVDSLDALQEYTKPDTPSRYKISSVGVFDVGAFDDSKPEYTAMRKAETIAKSGGVAERAGIDFFVVTSNLDAFIAEEFVRTVSLRNAACAYALSDVCDSYLGASSAPYYAVSVKPEDVHALDVVDSIFYPILSTARLEIMSARASVDRMVKTLNVLNNSPYVEDIEICTRPQHKKRSGKNCGTCGKCGQFMMVAEAHGPLERFAEAFDIEEYQRRKWVMFQRLITMIRSRKPNGETVLEYLDLRGFERPAGATVAGTLLAWSKWFS